MVGDKELKKQIAASLQTRMSWPQAEACADDLVQLFRSRDWMVVKGRILDKLLEE